MLTNANIGMSWIGIKLNFKIKDNGVIYTS